MQSLASICDTLTGCTGFTYNIPAALGGGPYGVLKFGDVLERCLVASPTTAFYAKAAAAPTVAAAPSSGGSSHTGAIVGGETLIRGGCMCHGCCGVQIFMPW